MLIAIRSDQKRLGERLDEIRCSLDHIRQLSESQGSFFVDSRPAHVATEIRSRIFAASYTVATLRLRKPLQGGVADIFAGSEFFEGLLGQFPTAGKVGYETEPIRLGVTDPESYRPRLLVRIVEQINDLRSTFGAGTTVAVGGLEGPVQTWQVSPQQVALTLDYKLSLRV